MRSKSDPNPGPQKMGYCSQYFLIFWVDFLSLWTTNSDKIIYTLGPCTMLPLGRQRCSVVQISVVQGNRYVVSVLLIKISVVQGQRYIVSVLYNSAVQVKRWTCFKLSILSLCYNFSPQWKICIWLTSVDQRIRPNNPRFWCYASLISVNPRFWQCASYFFF